MKMREQKEIKEKVGRYDLEGNIEMERKMIMKSWKKERKKEEQ